MSWTPTPGTIPALAIAHLRTLPPGTRLPTAVLAEAIGHDLGGLAAYLAPAKQMHVLCSEQIPGQRSHEWWLGPDAPIDPDQPIGDALATGGQLGKKLPRPMVRHQPSAPAIPSGSEFCAVPNGSACAPPYTELPIGPMRADEAPTIVPLPRIRAGTTPARWGFLSDGELHIQKGGNHVELDRLEFEALADFLRRTGGKGIE